MAAFSYKSFVKPLYLTEMALGVANDLFINVENHIENKEVWFKQLLNSSKWTDIVSDIPLEAIIKNYFFKILNNNNINLIDLICEFHKSDNYEGNYGKCVYELLNSSNKLKNTKEIQAKITIYLFRIEELTAEQAIKALYHELVHTEQDTKALINIGIDKLTTKLPSFIWTEVDEFLNKPKATTDEEYVNLRDELGPYSHDLALELFYKYRTDFKNKTKIEQEYFIRTKIVPNMKNEFSKDIRTEFLGHLTDSKARHKLYILIIKQLTDLASGVSNG